MVSFSKCFLHFLLELTLLTHLCKGEKLDECVIIRVALAAQAHGAAAVVAEDVALVQDAGKADDGKGQHCLVAEWRELLRQPCHEEKQLKEEVLFGLFHNHCKAMDSFSN